MDLLLKDGRPSRQNMSVGQLQNESQHSVEETIAGETLCDSLGSEKCNIILADLELLFDKC